jgi:PBSX family phage portal protein
MSNASAVVKVGLAPRQQEVLPALRARVIKEDAFVPSKTQSARQVQNRTYEFEDEFEGIYASLGRGLVLEPPFLARTLESLVQCNNTLSVCIDAVTTNVHASGFDIVPADESDKDTDAHKALQAFFDEVYPGISFLTLRKQLGYDQEATGTPYMEVIRSADGELLYLRRLDPKLIRLVRLDDPVEVPHKATRNGKTVERLLQRRFRRFVLQLTGQTIQFFKEYGCPFDLDCKTGEFAKPGETLPLDRRASEVLYFPDKEDSLTPYGVPKWISQLPSVLLSRKAEESNLQLLDNNGVPPLLVVVHGGALSGETATTLRAVLNGGVAKGTIPVIEALATGGDLNSPSNTKITIERFGSEKHNDALFQKLDEACEKRVRRAWRLPPMFNGIAESHNYATALAAYRMTESQVFGPARATFDDMINRTIMKELDPEARFYFRSRPMTLRDIETQLKALEVATSMKLLGREQLAQKLNEISSIDINVDDEDIAGEGDDDDWYDDIEERLGVMESGSPATGDEEDDVVKGTGPLSPLGPEGLADQVFQYFEHGTPNGPAFLNVLKQVHGLTGDDLKLFKHELTSIAMGQIFNPGLGIDFADRVVSTVLGMVEPKAA